MPLGDRLGLVGVILGLFAIAAPYLWPDKKWIGWVSLSLAFVLLGMWGWLEFRPTLINWYRSYPIKSTVLVFVCGGIIASAGWLLLNRENARAISAEQPKPSPEAVSLAPAGFITFMGVVQDGYGWMLQENQTETPLDGVHLSITKVIPNSESDFGTGTVTWQKEIEIGICRAKLTTNLKERFPIASEEFIRFNILILTRLQTYRETLDLRKESDGKHYAAEMRFYGAGLEPSYKKSMRLMIADPSQRRSGKSKKTIHQETTITPTVALQNSPGSAVSYGQQGGITAGTLIQGDPPPQFALTRISENVAQATGVYETKFKLKVVTTRAFVLHVKAIAPHLVAGSIKSDNERPPEQGGMAFSSANTSGPGYIEDDYKDIESGVYFLTVHTSQAEKVILEYH